ncbi:MAG: hypothetical protein ABIX37_06790 [Gammaproteobacteria bacterium]
MNLFIWVLVGSVLGWLSTLILNAQSERAAAMNVLSAIAGAIIAGVGAAFFGADTFAHGVLHIDGLAFSLLGALGLIGVIHLAGRS